MRSSFKNKKNARRPCVESLRLPIPRPSLFQTGPKNAHILPHPQSSAINRPVCHCLQDQCSGQFCDSFNDCMISDSFNESENEDDIHRECLNESEKRETNGEGNEINEIFRLGDRLGRETNSALNNSRIGKTPVTVLPSNTNNNEYDNLFHQQANQTSSQMPLNRDAVQDLESTENNSIPISHSPPIHFRNKDYIPVNTLDNTGVSEQERHRTANINSFGINFDTTNNDRQAYDKINRNENQVMFHKDVKEYNRSQLQQNLDRTYNIDKGSSQPKIQDIKDTSTIPRPDNNKSLHNDYFKRDVHPAIDVSNHYCLPSYIQVQTATDVQKEVSHIRNATNPQKQLASLTEYNSNNKKEHHENDSHQAQYKSMAETHNEQNINNNISPDEKIDEGIRSGRRHVSNKSTQSSNLYQSLQINPFEDTPSHFTHNNNSALQESSTVPEHFNHSTYSQEDSRKNHCQNKSKLISRNPQSSNSNNRIDFHNSSSGLSNRQGPDCCRGKPILKKKESRYKTQNQFRKSFKCRLRLF
nr:putative uncharacterized protein DDB_G0285119 [Vanessa tameamea]